MHRARHTFDASFPLMPWAMAIARHVWLMDRRTLSRRPWAPDDVTAMGLEAGAAGGRRRAARARQGRTGQARCRDSASPARIQLQGDRGPGRHCRDRGKAAIEPRHRATARAPEGAGQMTTAPARHCVTGSPPTIGRFARCDRRGRGHCAIVPMGDRGARRGAGGLQRARRCVCRSAGSVPWGLSVDAVRGRRCSWLARRFANRFLDATGAGPRSSAWMAAPILVVIGVTMITSWAGDPDIASLQDGGWWPACASQARQPRRCPWSRSRACSPRARTRCVRPWPAR